MKKNRLTAFIFACIGMGWLILTYALSIFLFQQMVLAAETGGTTNVIVALMLALFAAASLLIVVFLPLLPAIFGIIFSIVAIRSTRLWTRVISIVFTVIFGLVIVAGLLAFILL
jgi:hypothetical protein